MDGVTGYELNGAIYGTPRQDVEQPGLAWDSVNGGVFIAGRFVNSANFGDITIYSAGNLDAFVARIEVRKRIPDGSKKGNEQGERLCDWTIHMTPQCIRRLLSTLSNYYPINARTCSTPTSWAASSL